MQHRSLDRRAAASPTRAGFTLLELLVVVGIIAFLLAAAVTVFANYIRSAKVSQTAATIAKIQSILDQRIEAFNKQDFTAAARKFATQTGWNEQTSLIFARKQAFRNAFPQSLYDFKGTVPAPFSEIPSADRGEAYVSSALLYLAVTKGPTFGAPPVEEDAFKASELATSTSGVTHFVDAWGNPLRFYRWPTRLFRFGEDLNGDTALSPGEDVDGDGTLDAPGNGLLPSTITNNDAINRNPVFRSLSSQLISRLPPQRSGQSINNSDRLDPLASDPDDPLGLLRTVALTDFTMRQNFERGGSAGVLSMPWHTFGTWHTPLIVSAGPDNRLGLYEPNHTDTAYTDQMSPILTVLRLAMPRPEVMASCELLGTAALTDSHLTDNITNLNQQTGGN